MGFMQQNYANEGGQATVNLSLYLTSRNFSLDTISFMAKQALSQNIQQELAHQRALAPQSQPKLLQIRFFDLEANKNLVLAPGWLNES